VPISILLDDTTGGITTPVALTVSQATAPTLAKGAAKVITIAQAQAASLLKQAGKRLSASQGTTPLLTLLKSRLLSLTVAQATVPTLTKAATKGLAATLMPLAVTTPTRGNGNETVCPAGTINSWMGLVLPSVTLPAGTPNT